MTRRAALLLAAAGCLAADSAQDAVGAITEAATGLSAGRAAAFLDAFDPRMKDFAAFRDSIVGLVNQGDVECSISVESNEGSDTERSLVLDWILRVDRRDGGVGVVRRQETVKCKLRKDGKKWRITEIEPRSFFAVAPG